MTRLLRRNIWIEVGISFSLLFLSIFVLLNVDNWVLESMPASLSPAFFPSVILVVLTGMSAMQVMLSLCALRHMLRGEVDNERLRLQKGGDEAGRFMALIAYVGILFLYLAGMYFIGFVYCTPAIMLLVSLTLGLRNWLAGSVYYMLFTLALNYVALNYMQIILPTGVLFG